MFISSQTNVVGNEVVGKAPCGTRIRHPAVAPVGTRQRGAEELKPELRAQRSLNKQRVPEIARYILSNPNGHTFSALAASVDGKVKFEPLRDGDDDRNIGRLRIPMSARFVINDSQHRRATIETALLENSDLGDETISVVFIMDVGLKRCQQMLADLNRFSVRPTKSLGLLYDHRDQDAHITPKDVPGFLGRKPHGNFTGEVMTDVKTERDPGARIKHRMKGDWPVPPSAAS